MVDLPDVALLLLFFLLPQYLYAHHTCWLAHTAFISQENGDFIFVSFCDFSLLRGRRMQVNWIEGGKSRQ